jgi:beta-lactamase regulating signal transducer with metallopeptidase domain
MNVPDLFILSGSWLPVADAILKSTLLLGFTAAAALLMRRASAAARHCVWTLGLSAALILPALSFALPRWEMAVVTFEAPAAVSTAGDSFETGAPLSRGRQPRQPAMEQLGTPGTPGSDLAFPTSTATTTASAIGKARSDPRALVLAIWLAGVVAILGRLIAGLLAAQWMSRRTARVMDAPWLPLARRLAGEIGVGARLTFLRSDRATMPMAWGLVRPSVLMPADADSWPADRLRIVLLHELAHVRRRDSLTHVLSQIACAVYWFNPLVWIAARHARAER